MEVPKRPSTDKAPPPINEVARHADLRAAPTPPAKLTVAQICSAFILLGLWLLLFGGGITIDTQDYRCILSPGAVRALQNEANAVRDTSIVCNDEGSRNTDTAIIGTSASSDSSGPSPTGGLGAGALRVGTASVMVLLFFLPLNLALICAVAGALGTLGNQANLQDERTQMLSRDFSNPITSGLLRGFFIYLFLISGLLLIDDKPFSNPGPGQYIRLAGFLSLFSFLVNYQPHLFGRLLEWASERVDRGRRTEVSTTERIIREDKSTIAAEETVTVGTDVLGDSKNVGTEAMSKSSSHDGLLPPR